MDWNGVYMHLKLDKLLTQRFKLVSASFNQIIFFQPDLCFRREILFGKVLFIGRNETGHEMEGVHRNCAYHECDYDPFDA